MLVARCTKTRKRPHSGSNVYSKMHQNADNDPTRGQTFIASYTKNADNDPTRGQTFIARCTKTRKRPHSGSNVYSKMHQNADNDPIRGRTLVTDAHFSTTIPSRCDGKDAESPHVFHRVFGGFLGMRVCCQRSKLLQRTFYPLVPKQATIQFQTIIVLIL